MLSALKDKGQLEEGLKSTDAEGNTPLHHAARVGHMPCVKLLLEFGADATLLNSSQSSAIDVAGDAGKQDVADFLMKQSREHSLDTGSSNSTDADELSSSPKEDNKQHFGPPPKLNQGRKTSPIHPNSRHQTVNNQLIDACLLGDAAKVEMILKDKDADPNFRKADGATVVDALIHKKHFQLIPLLIESGLDVNLKLVNGTPLIIAMTAENQLPLIKLLVDRGADINVGLKHKDSPNHDITARDFALESEFTDIVDYLDSVSSTNAQNQDNGNKDKKYILM